MQVDKSTPPMPPSSATPSLPLQPAALPPAPVATATPLLLDKEKIVHSPTFNSSKETDLESGLTPASLSNESDATILVASRSEWNSRGDGEKGELSESESGAAPAAMVDNYPDGGWRAWR